MKESAVFVDVAIDQGGCAETSQPTTHDDPVYVVDGVIHYCVANMPGAVPITSTQRAHERHAAVRRGARRPRRARRGPPRPALARGVNVVGGRITYEAVADAHGLEYTPLDDALAAAVA